jgi:hypothetical protein
MSVESLTHSGSGGHDDDGAKRFDEDCDECVDPVSDDNRLHALPAPGNDAFD